MHHIHKSLSAKQKLNFNCQQLYTHTAGTGSNSVSQSINIPSTGLLFRSYHAKLGSIKVNTWE